MNSRKCSSLWYILYIYHKKGPVDNNTFKVSAKKILSTRPPPPLCDPIFCHSVASTHRCSQCTQWPPCPSLLTHLHTATQLNPYSCQSTVVLVKENGTEVSSVHPASSQEPTSASPTIPNSLFAAYCRVKIYFLLCQSVVIDFLVVRYLLNWCCWLWNCQSLAKAYNLRELWG